MDGQSGEIEWRDDRVPVATRFGDPYFSIHDGLAETAHVFLAGNGLPGRFGGAMRIAELGFGTGLNLLATVDAWHRAGRPGALSFTSFEAFPMRASDMARALSAFPTLQALAAPLTAAVAAGRLRFDLGAARVEIVPGDARETLPAWHGMAEAWFLDGFAPAKNPELWEPALLRAVFDHTAPGGTFATYSAAGAVRRTLAAAGFAVERVAGFGAKRHMTKGIRPA